MMDRVGFTVFLIDYLKKGGGGTWDKGDLGAGRTKKFFRAIFIFKQAV
jgi:hypothetical protein